jgi:phosphoribosylaminoimidazole carboxylase/phosphoribosylaminoimidazole-succinocarboxamide synthase
VHVLASSSIFVQVHHRSQDTTAIAKHVFNFTFHSPVCLKTTEINQSDIGKLIIEGKTKQVYNLKSNPDHVYVLNKDRITAGDGVKAHELKGKARLSTRTNGAVFEFLSAVGVKTHFVSRVSPKSENHETSFVARNCAMIPIEWVTRRVATGSYLKRNPHVKEGYRFYPPKLETFFKGNIHSSHSQLAKVSIDYFLTSR